MSIHEKKTVQERIAVVDEVLSRGGLILTDPLKRDSLKNRVFEDGTCIGYSFRLNNLSYRGIWISTIEDMELSVDGVSVPKADMQFRLGAFSCAVSELPNNSDVFWCCTDECWIDVFQVGGLSVGQHELVLTIAKRQDFGHSYGDGTDQEGYLRDATELQHPAVIVDKAEFTISESA